MKNILTDLLYQHKIDYVWSHEKWTILAQKQNPKAHAIAGNLTYGFYLILKIQQGFVKIRYSVITRNISRVINHDPKIPVPDLYDLLVDCKTNHTPAKRLN